jgi:hypothetical protein
MVAIVRNSSLAMRHSDKGYYRSRTKLALPESVKPASPSNLHDRKQKTLAQIRR